MADTALAMQLFMAGNDDIIVKENWRPMPGQPMPGMANVYVGKQFGAGAVRQKQQQQYLLTAVPCA